VISHVGLLVGVCRPDCQVSKVLRHRLHRISSAAWCTPWVPCHRGAATGRAGWTRSVQCWSSGCTVWLFLFVAAARTHRAQVFYLDCITQMNNLLKVQSDWLLTVLFIFLSAGQPHTNLAVAVISYSVFAASRYQHNVVIPLRFRRLSEFSVNFFVIHLLIVKVKHLTWPSCLSTVWRCVKSQVLNILKQV